MTHSSQGHRLTLQQKQAQRLSPLQVRYYRLLEMNGAAVEEEVQRELDANPALAVSDRPAPDSAPAPREADSPAYPRANNGPRAAAPLENVADREECESLQAHLGHQLDLLTLTPERRAMALYIAGSLDSNGYLRATLDELQQGLWADTGTRPSAADIRAALDDVRSLEPRGVGAVDLRDCLLLQLPADAPGGSPRALAREIVADWFDLLSLKHYDKLQQSLGISREQLLAALAAIKALNPKPGTEYASATPYAASAIAPDFVVEPDEQIPGRLRLTMPNSLPELEVEQSFNVDTPPPTRHGADEAAAAHAFIASRRDEARRFITLIQSRRDTLMRIMRAIIAIQTPFFLTGDEGRLVPMVLKDVAAVTGDDPSSISRATQGKYVATPWRTYPLRHFFSERAGVATDASQRSVARAIRELVDAESPSEPLSDEAIRARLADQGLVVARRTVAKHRETLGIPVARLRKKP